LKVLQENTENQETQWQATLRNAAALERIAAALEAHNQRAFSANQAGPDPKTGH